MYRTTCGGFFRDKLIRNNDPKLFFNDLRNYEVRRPIKKNDFLEFSKSFMSENRRNEKDNLFTRQRLLSARLSKPKCKVNNNKNICMKN